MLRQISILASATFLVVVFAPATSQATFIVKPMPITAAGVDYSTQFDANRNADNSRDDSGLADPSIVETGDPVPGTYPNHSTAVSAMWLSGIGDPFPYITYDLGQEYVVEGFHIWNYNEASAGTQERGVKDIDVEFSTTSVSAGFGSLESITNIAEAPGSSYAGDTDKIFASPTIARWVRFTVTDNWDAVSYSGISEVRFLASEVPPVPEPASGAMLGLGAMMVLGLARRRRRLNQTK